MKSSRLGPLIYCHSERSARGFSLFLSNSFYSFSPFSQATLAITARGQQASSDNGNRCETDPSIDRSHFRCTDDTPPRAIDPHVAVPRLRNLTNHNKGGTVCLGPRDLTLSLPLTSFSGC